jgi:uncharacterized protein YkuJ
MSQLLALGAINKLTNEYVYPKIANKKDEYICPDCNKDLILCQGEIKVHHFRHKVDTVKPCRHYSNPTETQIHKDAKMLLKTLLERKIPISFIRSCCSCKKNEEYEIPAITETSNIYIEYSFDFNGQKIADVAYIDNDQILCIFEICNTHKTCSKNRPEPWFEIDAETLVKIANDMHLISLEIPCIRCEKCEDCILKEKIQKKRKEINEKIEILNYELITITGWGATNSEKNRKCKLRKDIRKLEEELLLLTTNGEDKKEMSKEEKLNKLNQKLEKISNSRTTVRSNIDSDRDDTADDLRSMRYEKQDKNYKTSLLQEEIFIVNDINYLLGNNVISIEHPVTHTKVRRSLVNNKTFYKGIWRQDITINLLINWYKSNYDIIDEL